MRQQGVVPYVITYIALISGCEEGQQFEQALEVFRTMRQHGVLPNGITYSVLISTCEKGQLEQALVVFRTMQ